MSIDSQPREADHQAWSPVPFRVAAVQMDVKIGAPRHNLERIVDFAHQAAEGGARLVVLPECAVSGYCFGSLDEAKEHAQAIPGPATAALESVCRDLGIHVVFGLIEKAGKRIFNATALVGPNGVVGSYRKIHLPHLGVDHFVTPGDRPFEVHETPLCRVGMNICYDGSFPESARLLALAGADLVVLPTNWPEGAEEFALYCINARAMENKVAYAAANRIGREGAFRFIGLSRIVDEHGRTLAEADQTSEIILYGQVDPASARLKRVDRVPGKHWIDRFADRRPEFYGPLSQS